LHADSSNNLFSNIKLPTVSANKKTFRSCTNDKGRKVIRGTTLIAESYDPASQNPVTKVSRPNLPAEPDLSSSRLQAFGQELRDVFHTVT
jgi:hypothetical protein